MDDLPKWDTLPQEVQYIISSYDDDEDIYKECSRIKQELEGVGWYMDFDLSGSICELRPMTHKEIQQYNNDKIERKARG